jgi:xanthine dehydrogenase accessory factor
MKKKLLEEIIYKKNKKIEFSIITNLETAESFIFEEKHEIKKGYEKYKEKINFQILKKENGILEGTNIFIETYTRPIKIIIVGAVHIAQYLIGFAQSLSFEILIIDPRDYFASQQRFPGIRIIKKWPMEAFDDLKTDNNTALVALTHDPKIDDPALQYALKNNFFYIGALGSKKTHNNRCLRLKEAGFDNDEIQKIFGPIGIKLGGKSAPEIALSITAQLVSEVYKKK